MIRISDALRQMVHGNPLLQFALQHRLLNLRRTAAYLRPLVETKARKPVSIGALTMALSRLQIAEGKTSLQREMYRFDHIAIHTGLATFTFGKSSETHDGVQRLYAAVHEDGEYITIAEGTGQITVIVDADQAENVRKLIPQQPQYTHDRVASIGVVFGQKYLKIPGLIYIVLQQLMLLNINIIEVSSTFTELSLYVDEADLKPAFEALESLFHGSGHAGY